MTERTSGTRRPPDASLASMGQLEPWTLLDRSGELVGDDEPLLPVEETLAAYRLMRLSRQVDERAFSLQRQGRLGTFSQVMGQEAAVVGAAWALDPARDWVVPQYRELPAMLRQGYPLERFFQYFMGRPSGNEMPPGVRVLPFQISLAAQIPHAVGLGWGMRLRGEDGLALTFFGDGASSEGDTHEAMNLAGVQRAPVVFLLQNNGWAISTPVSRQTAATSFALRAPGYGFPGLLVDGNDLLAMYEATAWAVERARAGEGPTLIEARTFRLGAHNTADEPTRYVPAELLEEKRALDPLTRVSTYLRGRDALDDAADEAISAEVTEAVDAAIRSAEGSAVPQVDGLFEHVYGEPPTRLVAQRTRLEGRQR